MVSVHLGILGHRGLLLLEGNQIDLEQGNKIAVLGGDYLLSQACGKLADFRKPEVKSFEINYFDL